MKYFLSLIVTVSVLSTSLRAVEYGTLVAQQSDDQYQIVSDKVILNDGDLFEVLHVIYTYGDPEVFKLLLKDTRLPTVIHESEYNNDFTNSASAAASTADLAAAKPIVGPAEIFIVQFGVPNGNRVLRVSYKLTRASESEYKNVNIVSLPSSTVGSGTHEIVVEASDDLQSWTPVHSSSIGGNKTFFRTRVTEISD